MSWVPSSVLITSMFTMWRITWYSSETPLAPCMSRQSRAMSSALPVELRFTREIISGVTRFSSRRRLMRRHDCRPKAISVCISTSFFWIS